MKQHKKLTQAIQKARDRGECEKGHRAVWVGFRKGLEGWMGINAPTNLRS